MLGDKKENHEENGETDSKEKCEGKIVFYGLLRFLLVVMEFF